MRRFLVYLLSLIFLQSVNASCPWGGNGDVTVFCTDENPYGITYMANKLSSDIMTFGTCSEVSTEIIKRKYFTLDEIVFLDSVYLLQQSGECDYMDCYSIKYEKLIDDIYDNAPTYEVCKSKVTGCLGRVTDPAWFAFQIEDEGNLTMKITQSDGEDIDFACWGPFYGDSKDEMLNKVCSEDLLDDGKLHKTSPTDDWDITKPDFRKEWDYPYGNLQDCSYSKSHTEYCYLPNAKKGEWYILMISNYAETGGYITFNKFSGTATTDCSKTIDLTSNSPVCEGEDLKLKVLNAPVHATFKWTGPDGFESTERNPVLKNASASASGTYYLTLTNNGVSSDPTPIDVTVYPTNTYDTVTVKQGEAYTFGGKPYSEAGDYQHTFKSQNGCDSVVHLHLVVEEEVEEPQEPSENASCPWGSPNDVTVFCTDENPLGITYDAMKSTTAFASVGVCSDRTSDLIEHTYFTLEEAMFIDSVKNIRNAGLCDFYCYRDNYRDSVEALYKKANVYKSCYRATGCLGKIAYPSWFAFQIEEGGELAIKIEHVDENDIDFIKKMFYNCSVFSKK